MPRARTKNSGKTALRSFSFVWKYWWLVLAAIFACLIYIVSYSNTFATKYTNTEAAVLGVHDDVTSSKSYAPLDKAAYDAKLLSLAHIGAVTTVTSSTSTSATTTKPAVQLWPAPTLAYPLPGALLPFNRIIAYYGNFYSKGMGVLGEYPEDVMIAKLNAELASWKAADPETPVVPAIDYIAVTAQGSAGADGKYRLRMPDSQIDRALELAHKVNGIVILDVQVGLSNLQSELPPLAKYLAMPEVHLAIDPEFSMKTGKAPGTVIGTMDANDINYASNFLAALVRANKLPPKVLVVHRFTRDMVTGYKRINQLPEVQIVMDMDGWGSQAKKRGTYNQIIYPEPVQFTGFKLFYKNDLKAPSTGLLTPSEVLGLTPAPSFIQYQ